jgi:hypothetical protein
MPVTVELLPGEPILYATLVGDVTVDDMRAMFIQSAQMTQDMPGPIYRITDTRQGRADFMGMLQTVRAASDGTPGSSTDPKFKPVFLGTNEMVRMGVDMLKKPQFGGIQIPIFREIDDALIYIRHEIMKGQPVQDHDHRDL